MAGASSDSDLYRGICIKLNVEGTDDGAFGHADLFEDDAFIARLAVGACQRDPNMLRGRLLCLAKAKIDVLAITRRLQPERLRRHQYLSQSDRPS